MTRSSKLIAPILQVDESPFLEKSPLSMDEYFFNMTQLNRHARFIVTEGGARISYPAYLEARRVHNMPLYRVRCMITEHERMGIEYL